MSTPLLLLSLSLLSANISPDASVVVVSLQPRQGVTQDTADLLTTHLLAAVKERRVFGRVVSMQETETLLSVERQRSLMGCTDASCTAELAGALGVDYVLSGSLGRLGPTWLVSASLLHARTAASVATVSLPVEGESEAVLVPAVGVVVDRLLGISAAPPSPAPAPAPATPALAPAAPAATTTAPLPAPQAPASPVVTPSAEPAARPMWATALMGGGVAVLAAAGVALVLGAVSGAVAGSAYAYWWAQPENVTGRALRTAFLAVVGAGGALGVLALVVGLALGAAGGGSVAVGAVAS
ncbi:MAG: hypothetical protein AB2A00_01835 [Myxococcota bacterium]